MNPTQLEPKFKMTTRALWCALTVCIGVLAAQNVQAASQTWKAAPTDATWTNVLNWYGGAAPGSIDPAANALSGDTVNFTNALSGTIGSSSNPIMPDNKRDIKYLWFDGVNCGAHVIGAVGSNILEVTSTGSGTGNITVNTPVVNPIAINAPLYTRLASSTSGFYSFINNAANTSATLSINSVTNGSSSSRPMNFTLDGSNTGVNTIGRIDDLSAATQGGAILLVKQGAGTWVLTGANDLPQKTSTPTTGSGVAAVAVTAGKLEVQNAGSLGGITVANLTVTNTGTLQIDGVTLNNNGITLDNGGTIKMNGSGTLNSVVVGTDPATSVTLSTTGSSDLMTVGIAANKLTGGASDTVLHVAGSGTVSLAYGANYAGKWSVDAGTLAVANSTALGTGSQVNVAAGATLDLSPLGAVTYTSAMGFAGSGTGTSVGTTAATIKADPAGVVDLATGGRPLSLTITPTAFSGDTAHPALYVSQGTLSLNGNAFTINNAAATPLGLGNYTLIHQATGNITSGSGYTVTAVTGTGLASATAASIQVVNGDVILVVSPYVGVALKWQGDGGNNYWDTTALNFTNGSGVAVKFSQGDFPTFDDTSVNQTVNLTTTLQPGSVTVNANANNYLFNDANGSGLLSGSGGITKNGSSTLTIVAANINTGPTVINAGTVQVGTNGIKGDLGSGNVTNNGALVFYQSNSHTQNGLITGTGSLTQKGAGTLTLTANNTYTGATIITNGTLQVGTNGATGSLGSGVITNDGTLVFNRTGSFAVGNVKTGPGNGGYVAFAGAATVTLNGGNTYYNNTIITNGVVKLGASEAIPSYVNLGYTYGWLIMDGGTTAGTLDLNGYNQSVNALSGNSGTVNGLITNSATTGTNTLTVGGGALTTSAAYNGLIQDNGATPNTGQIALRLLGANTSLTLAKANAYNGGTIVGGGTLTLNNNASAGGGSITLSNGASLAFTGTGLGNAIYVAAGATATNSVTQGNSAGLSSLFSSGDTNSVLVVVGSPSINSAATEQFSGFQGTVLIPSGNGMRFSASSGFSDNGGPNTTFQVDGSMSTRNGMTSYGSLKLGALSGAGTLTGGNNAGGATVNYVIGGKNIDSIFSGTVQNGSLINVSLTKVGAGKQTLSGTLTYTGNTTVSGGTLALAGTASLDGSPTIDLSSATVDVSGIGGTLNLGNTQAQTLSGFGTVNGSLNENANSFVSVGLGVLAVTNAATLNGAVTLQLNRTNAVTCSEITATGFSIGGAATLTVTNVGTALQGGDTFQLFGGAVSGFGVTNLPPLTGVLYWTNNLAVNGSITVIDPSAPTAIAPTNSSFITGFTLSGTNVLVSGTNFDSGATYYLLTSTNVALSLPQWKTVATNVAGAGVFTFTFTNAMIPYASQKFFTLSSTNYNP